MSFTGKYEGVLWYGDQYPIAQIGKELRFQVQLVEGNNFFTGNSTDIKGIGMSPDNATVEGMISENVISFEKIYERSHYTNKRGELIVDNKRQPIPILYEGEFNNKNGFYEGTWRYNAVRRFLFFFERPLKLGSGTFSLKKIDT